MGQCTLCQIFNAMKNKKYLVALILCAGILVTLCNASCFFAPPPDLMEGETLKGCFHEGKLYELDSDFRAEDVLDCSCYSDGSMQCCVNYKALEDSKKGKLV
ncbi:beta-microseminoprotein-like [Hyla sarda]|uniref:beta-microseminoprotein-like n=1 Tax=Hyla sarda TaxID=327740 RepID=UPI0024C44599|nr:beta-microseminoprotein-like [Hyla sarda]